MSKSHDFAVRAVVVSRASALEGSVRVFLYTEEQGLVGAFARSAREERSQLRAHLQIGCFGRYSLVKSAYDWRVTGATETRNVHFALGGDSVLQKKAARVLSIVRTLVHGEGENEELFQALWAFLEALPSLAAEEAVVAERLAVLRILSSLGYVAEGNGIPHLKAGAYDSATLADVAPHEGAALRVIQSALAASHLA